MKIFAFYFAVASLVLIRDAQSQIPVGIGGTSAVMTFDSSPILPAREWASSDNGIGANADTYFFAAEVDAAIQGVNQSSISNALSRITVNGLSEDARHNTAGGYLVTQATSEGALLLKATLRNTSGQTIDRVTVNYNFGVAMASNTESAPGHEVFFSTNGLPNTWQRIPQFSGLNIPSFVTAQIVLGSWLPNADIYLLWADDNNGEGSDAAYTIDNFFVSNVILTPVCVPPTFSSFSTSSSLQPDGVLVTYTANVSGTSPLFYQWTFNDDSFNTIFTGNGNPVSHLFGPFDPFPTSFNVQFSNDCGGNGGGGSPNPPCGPICLSSAVGSAPTQTGTAGSGTNVVLNSSCGSFTAGTRWFLMSKLTNAAGVAFVTTDAANDGTMLGVFRGGINPANLLSMTCSVASNNQPARVEFETRPNSNYWLAVRSPNPASLTLTYGYPLEIAAITRSNNAVNVRSEPLPSLAYHLFGSTNLSIWTSLSATNFSGNISATNNILRFTEPNIFSYPQRFYQIRP